MRELNTNQLLRLAVEGFGEALGIEKFYDRVKKYEWRVKNASERSEKWKLAQIEKFRFWRRCIEDGTTSKEDAIRATYLRQVKLYPKRKTK